MPSRRSVWCGVALIASLLAAEAAWATIDNLKAYKTAYPGKEPKAYSCKVCHEGAIGKKGDLNAYGTALKEFKAATPADAKKLTAEDFQAFDAADTDADGATNAQELEAGTDPLDAISIPELKPSAEGGVEESVENHEQLRPPEGETTEEPHSAVPKSRPGLSAYLDQLMGSTAWASTTESSPKAEYVGVETCAACHADIAAKHRRSPHAQVGADGPEGLDISCESCHGPGSLHTEAGGGKGVGGLVNPSKDPSTCYACHTDKKMEFSLQYHHPVPEGRMSCTDCHGVHGEPPTPRSAKAQNDLCLSCHQQLKGPWVFEHLAMRDGCVTCHQPHGSITTRLLTERDFNLCLKCHFSGLQFQQIGHYAHRRALNPSTREGATCTGCHRSVHGSNFSKELRTQ